MSERLERYSSTLSGEFSILHKCPLCWVEATGKMDNGWVATLPYPHTAECRAELARVPQYDDYENTESNEELTRLERN